MIFLEFSLILKYSISKQIYRKIAKLVSHYSVFLLNNSPKIFIPKGNIGFGLIADVDQSDCLGFLLFIFPPLTVGWLGFNGLDNLLHFTLFFDL